MKRLLVAALSGLGFATAHAQSIQLNLSGGVDPAQIGSIWTPEALGSGPLPPISYPDTYPLRVSLTYNTALAPSSPSLYSTEQAHWTTPPLVIDSMSVFLGSGEFVVPILHSDILQGVVPGSLTPEDRFMSFFFSTFGELDVLGRTVTVITVGQLYTPPGVFWDPNSLSTPPTTIGPDSILFRSTFAMSINGWRFAVPEGGFFDIPTGSSGGIGGAQISSASYAVLAAPIPEPETYFLLLAGLGLVGFEARRRKKLQSVTA